MDRHRPRLGKRRPRAAPSCPCCTAPACPSPRPPRGLPSGSTPILTLRALVPGSFPQSSGAAFCGPQRGHNGRDALRLLAHRCRAAPSCPGRGRPTAPIAPGSGGRQCCHRQAQRRRRPRSKKRAGRDSTAAGRRPPTPTVAESDLYWRLSATVPAGAAYDTYAVQFVDTMSAGLDLSKGRSRACACTWRQARDGGFGRFGQRGRRAGTEPAKGWADITARCRVSVEGSFTVRTGDLIAALGRADAFAATPRGRCVRRSAQQRMQPRHRRDNPNEATCAARALSLCRPVLRSRLHPHAER